MNEDLLQKQAVLESKIEETMNDNTNLAREYGMTQEKIKEIVKDNSYLSEMVNSTNEEILRIIKCITNFVKTFKKSVFSSDNKEAVYQLERYSNSFSQDIATVDCMVLIAKWLEAQTVEVKVKRKLRKVLTNLIQITPNQRPS